VTPLRGRRWWRSTIRVRLTLLYAGVSFVAAATLVALIYLYFRHSLGDQLIAHLASTEQLRSHSAHGLPPDVVDRLKAQYRQDHDSTMRSILVASLVSVGILGVAAAGCGWLLAGRALRPLRDITATARRVADRNLHERIALRGPDDEMKDLADTFDAMLERLDRAFDSQRRFVANASHELRTPLTINRALIEVALDDPQADQAMRQLGTHLLAVNQRHERLIDGLLTLASSEEQLGTREPTDLASIAGRIVTEAQAVARADGVRIRTTLAPASVAGDPVLLERLAHNLVDNAIRYNLPELGWVDVTTGVDGTTAQLVVENPGPHIDADELPGLFEPFRRLATAGGDNDGAGLGLSIVRAVARAHGGEVHATARPDGGLAVCVRIPAWVDQVASGVPV
jgi:signal transduction histidine kinase